MEAVASTSRALGGNATGGADAPSDDDDDNSMADVLTSKRNRHSSALDRTGSKGSGTRSNRLFVPGTDGGFKEKTSPSTSAASAVATNGARRRKGTRYLGDSVDGKVTVNDVERDRGQPLSKYDRNMMIFNWLLTLESEESLTTSCGGNSLASEGVLSYL